MAASTLYSMRQVSAVDRKLDHVVDQRLPTVIHLSTMAFELVDSIGSVRGVQLTGEATFREARAASWKSLEEHRLAYREEAKTFTNETNKVRWAELDALLTEIKTLQDQMEASIPTGSRASDEQIQRFAQTHAPKARRAIEIIEGDGRAMKASKSVRSTLLSARHGRQRRSSTIWKRP